MGNRNDSRDARVGLARNLEVGAAGYARFYADAPQYVSTHAHHWYARGQNFIVGYIEARLGETIARVGQPDEYALLLTEHDGAGIEVDWASAGHSVHAGQLAFVPPGDSCIRVTRAGRFYLIATTRSRDLCVRCTNALAYAQVHSHVASLQDWPVPADGWRVRRYDIDVLPQEGRFGRIWRCTTLMINVLPDSFWLLRGPTQLSPHQHDSFEQGSLALHGCFTHHLRWPWTPDRTRWREDAHESCGSPSLTVIPPYVLHTSEPTGSAPHLLVDVFAPPRMDFSLQSGWVLNADDYPMPATFNPA